MSESYKSRVYTDRPAYAYRRKYNEYKAARMRAERNLAGQTDLWGNY